PGPSAPFEDAEAPSGASAFPDGGRRKTAVSLSVPASADPSAVFPTAVPPSASATGSRNTARRGSRPSAVPDDFR
ncbi:hypothetical protein, partial [[Kitasatospora] papulosa]|uniref:hypothetical protein n=1 Tax=[Kitasatospora] papulosa TaxID=1464011 RepID=UPI0036AFE972